MKFTVEHMGIMADNPRKLADWYCGVLGFVELFSPEGENMPVFTGDGKGVVLEFFRKGESYIYPAPDQRKNQHISLAVEDFDKAVAHLESSGITFADKAVDIFMGGKVRFFQDPEGNWIHLVFRPVMPW